MINNTITIPNNLDTYAKSINELIMSLSEDKMKEAFNFLTYLKDKDEWEATMELASTDILSEIQKGISEINSEKFVNFNKIRKNV